MTKRFMNPNGKILAAINLDDASIPALKAAGDIAKRTGLGLVVLHVNEYWVGRTWPTEMMLGGPMGGIASAVEDESLKASQERLRSLVSEHISDIAVQQEVLLGYPLDCIRSHAQTIGAELIVVGGISTDYKFVPQGLSTVLGLFDDASCPVLALPKENPGHWDKGRLKALLSDDLTPHTETAVMVGYEWAAALGNVDLVHLHVNQMTKRDLKVALDSAAAAAHTPQGVLNVDTVWNGAVKSIETALQNRAPGRQHLLEARGGALKTSLLDGDPAEAVLKRADQEDADVLIFGRHRTWHTKPFTLGRMPFHSMLKSGRPVLIANH